MSSSSSLVIRFGIELELLLASTGKKHNSWSSLAGDLSKRLTAAGVPNHVGDDHTYAEWSIVPEMTVEDNNPYHYGVELVSPIYTASEITTFHNTLITIFDLLNSSPDNISLIPTPRTSSHIHLSRDLPLSVDEVARLAKAALYYESKLDSLMPVERGSGTTTHWAQSNRELGVNPVFGGLEMCGALGKIDMAVGRGHGRGLVVVEPRAIDLDYGTQRACWATTPANRKGDVLRLANVVMAMNMVSSDSRVAIVCHHREEHFVRGKTYKWDFSGLLSVAAAQALASTAEPSSSDSPSESGVAWREASGPKHVLRDDIDLGIDLLNPGIPNTIEFRQPPGSLSAEDALNWVVLAVAFFAGAVKPELEDWIGELGTVLQLGGKDLGWEHLRGLEKLLEVMPPAGCKCKYCHNSQT
ncbi:hypothetical protein B0J18DRAFT_441808 [Chaetomium sp. MPI-SDFR-AT-0129]|nr:hypothetical protein B0J18DRAFT_441808 [Chaetomium sp. MPI-SDFR-AT-0129]